MAWVLLQCRTELGFETSHPVQAQFRSVGPTAGIREWLEMGRSPSTVQIGPLGGLPGEGQAKGRRRPGLGTEPFPEFPIIV